MTTSIDPEDGSLVEREGVDAGSARSTAEGPGQGPAEGPLLTGGTTTGRPPDRAHGDTGDDAGGQAHDEDGGQVTQPAQVWADSAGGVVDPAAGHGSESGQDEGSIE